MDDGHIRGDNTAGDPLSAPECDDLASADAELGTDFAKYFLSLPEPPDNGAEPELTLQDLAAECQTATGVNRLAALAAQLEPGERTAQILSVLPSSRLSAAGLLDAACAAERLASWIHASQLRHLAAFARPGVAASTDDLTAYASAPGQPLHPKKKRASGDAAGSVDSFDSDLTSSASQVHGDPQRAAALAMTAQKVAAAELSAALLISPLNASRRVAQATTYVEDLPSTLAALNNGTIDRGRAMMIADRTQNLPTDLRKRVEEVILPKAGTRTAGQLRAIADRAVIAVDPEAAKKRHETAKRTRNVSLRPDEDGMSQVRADLTADKACTAFNLIDQIAMMNARDATERRPIGALRADAFTDIFDQLADHGTVHLRNLLSSRDNSSNPEHPTTDRSDNEGSTEYQPSENGGTDSPPPPPNESDLSAADNGEARNDGSSAKSAVNGSDFIGSADDDGIDAERVGTDATDADQITPDQFTEDRDATTENNVEVDVTSEVTNYLDTGEHAGTDSSVRAYSEEISSEVGNVTEEFTQAGPRIPATDSDHITTASASLESTNAAGNEGESRSATSCTCADTKSSNPVPERGLGTHQGRPTNLNITMAATTLAGLDDLPAELDGYGAVHADIARTLLASAATITAVAVNPTCGTALDLGRTLYRPRLAIRDYVTKRDQTCRFASCRQPAWRCEIDHSNEFCPEKAAGGVTCPCNLVCLCKFHHDLKTFRLWDTEHHPDGSITWTSPIGRTYTTQPRQWLTGMADEPSVKKAEVDASITNDTRPECGLGESNNDHDYDEPPF